MGLLRKEKNLFYLIFSMKLVYTNKASIPLDEYEQTDAVIFGRFGINFPVYCFEKKGVDEEKELCEILVYPLSTATRQKLLTFSAFVVGHLGNYNIFSFLFESSLYKYRR